MTLRPYTSEAYSEGERPEAWRDVLASIGLRPTAVTTIHAGHATAVRRSFQGVTLARLSAGPQAVSASADRASDHPLVLLPLEDNVALKTAAGHQIIAAGNLILLPSVGDWSVAFQRDMRAVVLAITPEPAHGRRAAISGGEVRVLAPAGLGNVFAQMMELGARDL